MQQHQLKTYFKFGILLLGIMLSINACLNDDDIIQDQTFSNNERKVHFLSEHELPQSVFSHFKTQANKLAKNSNLKSQTTGTSIDIDHIMQVIDTIGNINYTF